MSANDWREPAACWTKDAARRVLGAEAEGASEAVFLASHAPLPITLLDGPGTTEGRSVDEEAVLAATLEVGLPIVAILGSSGSGKSHMVRWLRHRLAREPREDLVVVFVPKHEMSLRGIAERVLTHGQGPEFDELRASVASATEGLTEEMVVLRLRSALANQVQLEGAKQREGEDDTTRELRTVLARGLPAVLNDPYAGELLMRAGAPIRRLALENLEGRQRTDGDKERPFAFEADDLHLNVADLKQAARATQSILGQLTANSVLRTLGARMLNEQLERAVEQVFNIGGPTITEIFLRLRRQLHANGQRLLLLIEDFSIFQGVEGGIIDALTLMPGEGEGGADFCELRAVMAVTTGYFTNMLPDTVKTRTHRAFDLTPPEGVEPDVERFAAGYLNAARIGPEALAAQGADVTPNACTACPVQEECHAAFGASEGFGLFPLSTALVRATAENMPGGFVARDYLTRVLEPLLVYSHSDIDRGAFPGEAFIDRHREINAAIITAKVRSATEIPGDPGGDERRAAIAQLYADRSRQPTPWPPDRIYTAFGVTPPGRLPAPDAPVTELEPNPGNDTTPPPQRDADTQLIEAIELWNTTGGMADQFRRRTLQLIIDAVGTRLRLDDGHGGVGPWAHGLPPLTIESFALSTDPSAAEAGRVIVQQSNVTARALVALVKFRRDGEWGVGNGVERRNAEASLARWTVDARRLVIRPTELTAELPHLVAALRADAWGRGSRPAFSSDPVQVLAAVVGAEPPDSIAATSEDLQKLVNGWKGQTRTDLVAQLLRTVGHSQGSGEARLVDAVALLDALAAAPALPDPSRLPAKIAGYATHVAALLGPGRLGRRLTELRDRLPDLTDLGDDVAALAADLDATLAQLSARGLLPAAAVPLKDLGQRIADLPGRVARLRDLAARVDALDPADPAAVLLALATVELADAELVGDWLVDCERALTAVEGVLARGPATSPLTSARTELQTALERLEGAAEGTGGGGTR